jgi:hypothetical protein
MSSDAETSCRRPPRSAGPKSKSAASTPPSRAQSPKPDGENHPLHPCLSHFIRLKKEKLPTKAGIASPIIQSQRIISDSVESQASKD